MTSIATPFPNPAASAPGMRSRMPVIAAIAAGLGIFVILMIGGVAGAWIAVLLAALAVLGMAKPDIATVAVVFTIYADLAPVAVRSHGVPKALAVSFFLLVMLPAAYYVVGRGERIRFDAVLGLMFAYLGVQIASVVFGGNKIDDSIQVITTFVGEGIVTYFLLLNTIRTPNLLRRCVWAVVMAGVLLGSVSVLQNRMHDYDREFGGLALTRLATTQTDSVIATEDSSAADRATRPRAMGPIGDPNFYAQIMVVLLPLCALRLWAEKKRALRWAALLALVPILGAVVLTFSRGAALAAVCFCLLLLALRYLKIRHWIVPAVIAAVVVVSTPEYAVRISTLFKMKSPGMRAADSSLQERSTIYLSAIRIFADHPVLGVGIGQVKEYLPAYSNFIGHSRLHRKMGAHNMYLEMLAETGILGFGVFAAMVIACLRRLVALRRYWMPRNPEFAHTATSLLLAIIVFLITGLFLHLAYARYFWLLLVLAGAASYTYAPPQEKELVSARVAAPLGRRAARHAYEL